MSVTQPSYRTGGAIEVVTGPISVRRSAAVAIADGESGGWVEGNVKKSDRAEVKIDARRNGPRKEICMATLYRLEYEGTTLMVLRGPSVLQTSRGKHNTACRVDKPLLNKRQGDKIPCNRTPHCRSS